MPPASRPRRALRTVLVRLCGLIPVSASAVAVPPAAASRSVVTTMADDAVLNGTHGAPAPIVARWRDAGVRNVRLFAQWSHLAPAVGATRPPDGDGPRGGRRPRGRGARRIPVGPSRPGADGGGGDVTRRPPAWTNGQEPPHGTRRRAKMAPARPTTHRPQEPR